MLIFEAERRLIVVELLIFADILCKKKSWKLLYLIAQFLHCSTHAYKVFVNKFFGMVIERLLCSMKIGATVQ